PGWTLKNFARMRRVELVRWRRAPLSIWDRYDWLIDRPCFCLSSRTTSSWVTSRPRPRRTPSTSRRKRTFSPSVILLLAISYCNQRSHVKRTPGLRVADPGQRSWLAGSDIPGLSLPAPRSARRRRRPPGRAAPLHGAPPRAAGRARPESRQEVDGAVRTP